MLSWQIATAIMIISFFQIAIATLYMRKQALTHPLPNIYQKWRTITILSIILLVISLILLVIPEHIWWI